MTTTGAIDRWVSDTTPAELVHFATPSTTAQIGAFLHRLADLHPRTVAVWEIGRGTEGRPIYAVRLGREANDSDNGTLRAMLYGQQHGGEAAGMEACLLLTRELALGSLRPLLDHLTVWLVPQVNPDGAAIGQRQTATGADLNRGHHLLAEPEHRALYGLFHDVRPHLTVDLHEHGVVRDPHYLPAGGIDAYDLVAEGPTNLNVGPAIRPLADEALEAIERGMTADGFLYRRYVPFSPDGPMALIPRYSNLAVYGGRGQPSIWGCLSFLTEAMRHSDVTGRLERRTRATYSAAKALLEFADDRADQIRETVEAERARLMDRVGQPVVLRAKYRRERQVPPLPYTYWQTNTGATEIWQIHEAGTTPEVIVQRPMPAAYWIDLDHDPAVRDTVLRILDGHHITHERTTTSRRALIETHRINQFEPEDWAATSITVDQTEGVVPAEALIVPTERIGANLAALLLEPESMNGLAVARLVPAIPGTTYPVKRLVSLANDG